MTEYNIIKEKSFKLINRISGWLVFLIAAITYLLTIEPTVSFWDCGEFITSSFKLEVGHPPGAPFFMLLARFFSVFTNDVTQVARMINSVSAVASAFTILFLFWTISHIAKRIVGENEYLKLDKVIVIVGSAIVGSLAYTFSDTFWFSAVEGEVYAMSSLFTAIVFWAVLKWENIDNQKYANRWLIFIAYMMGLSIGVHLLNLLAIPAIIFVYYFRKYQISKKGIIYASLISLISLASIMYVIIPGVVNFAAKFELLFTNSFGLPYNFGAIFYFILLIGLIVFAVYYTYVKKKVLLNTIFTMITVILIGYSSFALIIIRSNADTPMNQNKPDNLFSMLSYLNREQYGDRPLLFGQYFNADVIEYGQGAATYIKKDGKYIVADRTVLREFDSSFMTFFPRMYSDSDSPNHKLGYMKWASLKNQEKKPSFAQNLSFFFKYQVNYMYLRYFMWNFVGRQNDIQGESGNVIGNENFIEGNWLSGITFIDEWRLGPQDKLTDEMKKNKGRNKYYFLPLLLGIFGIVYLLNTNLTSKNFFWVVFLFFIFTGLAIVVYLNQPPFQPRERDYAYAGSFYAFSIWIGLGVFMIYELFNKFSPKILSSIVSVIIAIALVPTIMAFENYDDHNRSGRYTARDFAKNYLNSCAQNAILFTNGDNDTFPLWYAQEVEGIRTDVRVINLSYLSTDWYISQQLKKAYNGLPVPFSYKYEQFMPGKRDVVYVQDILNKRIELKELVQFVGSDDSRTKDARLGNNDFFPSNKIKITVDSALVLKKGIISEKEADKMVSEITWDIPQDYFRKNHLMVLDLLANNNWERPIYFAITVGLEGYYNLQDYFRLDGMAYKFVPIKSHVEGGYQFGSINTDVLYDNLMNKFKWGGINNPKVYLDENNSRMLMNLKNNFSRLANALIDEGKIDSAITVLDKTTELMPNELVSYNYYNLLIAESYFKAGANEKATDIIRILSDNVNQNLNYYLSLPVKFVSKMGSEKERTLAMAQEILRILAVFKQDELFKEINSKFEETLIKYQ
ncbi:MAG: DUF2723 domain-containing protein [Bacteroidales bacterium]|nr:DUF2723 domain-containing protein [Bacteroidales bacterium]MBN2757929.1 DUF2723 domain-containing protein [Bacteroidales bacterium]